MLKKKNFKLFLLTSFLAITTFCLNVDAKKPPEKEKATTNTSNQNIKDEQKNSENSENEDKENSENEDKEKLKNIDTIEDFKEEFKNIDIIKKFKEVFKKKNSYIEEGKIKNDKEKLKNIDTIEKTLKKNLKI